MKFQYDLLKNIGFEEQEDEQKQMKVRQESLTQKIEKIITENTSDRLERQLINLDTDIIKEIVHIQPV